MRAPALLKWKRLFRTNNKSGEDETSMKYCRFQTDAGPQYGEGRDRHGFPWIVNLLPPPEHDPWTKVVDLPGDPLPLTRATLLAPVVPSKIVCIGRNYRDHAAELGNEVPKEPLIFF